MIRYDWTDVEADVRILYDAIKKRLNENNQKIGTIIGIQRGGLIPAVMLSHLFRVEMKSLRWQTRDQSQSIDDDTLTCVLLNCKMDEIVLVVDEIADSGKTLNDIHKQIASGASRCNICAKIFFLKGLTPNLGGVILHT